MEKRDYYEVLGIDRSASDSDIRSAYRRLAMKYHPDRNNDDPNGAEERFKEVQEAYDVLKDSQNRSNYDRFGFAGVDSNAHAHASAEGFSDFFGDIFSDFFGGARQSRRPRTGSDLKFTMDLNLEEAAFGVEKEIRIPTYEGCDPCEGTGARAGTSASTCPTCHGRGQVRTQQLGFTLQQTCPQCHGRGEVITDPCPNCNGQGRVHTTRNISVKIPAGIDDGNQVRLSGQGEAGPQGVPPGDLYVQVNLLRHSIFARDGDDLHCEMPISFKTAALGGTLEVPTLEGRAKLKVPPETQTGKRMRLRGKGIANVRSGQPGDLICQLVIETPVSLTPKQKGLLDEFEELVAKGGSRHCPHSSRWTRKIKSFWDKLAA